MKFTVISPLHRNYNKFIKDAYGSLVAQTHSDWEFVVVLNNGGKPTQAMLADSRVIPVKLNNGSGIGALKKFGASKATGDVIVELDADDMLLPNALEELNEAFADNAIAMAYSNSASFNKDWQSTAVYSD